jgi:hypothetical protein
MTELIAYFEGQCSELKKLIEESEAAREKAPTWLVEAQLDAATVRSMQNHAF